MLFDVTGSMGRVPRILQENLCQLMGLLLRKSYLAHPQILIGGIGDATCDRAPLQVGQFESGIEIDEDLAKLWLEGGGGGQQTESYELAMYFMARKTSLDCLEKQASGDTCSSSATKCPTATSNGRRWRDMFGDGHRADIPVEEMVRELEAKYDTYFILPNLTSYYDDPKILGRWIGAAGPERDPAGRPQGISELIAATIGMAEGVVDLDGSTATSARPDAGASPTRCPGVGAGAWPGRPRRRAGRLPTVRCGMDTGCDAARVDLRAMPDF